MRQREAAEDSGEWEMWKNREEKGRQGEPWQKSASSLRREDRWGGEGISPRKVKGTETFGLRKRKGSFAKRKGPGYK